MRDIDQSSAIEHLAQGGFIFVRGWALATNPVRPLDFLSLGFGDSVTTEAMLGIARDDLRAAFGEPARDAGFYAAVPALAPAGNAAVILRARSGDGKSETTIRIEEAVQIEPPGDPFAGLEQRGGMWEYAIDGVFAESRAIDPDIDGVYVLAPEQPAQLRLWVVDATTSRRAARTVVARSGGRYLPVTSGIMREDVANFLGEPLAAACGASMPIAPGPVGIEDIAVYAIRDDGSYADVLTVRVRQPDPLPSSVLPASTTLAGALDEIVIDDRAYPNLDDVQIGPAAHIRLRGWAVDEAGPRLCGGIEVLVDGMLVVSGLSVRPRPDIVARYDRRIAACEFEFSFDLPSLVPGVHVLVVRALSARRDATADLLRGAIRI